MDSLADADHADEPPALQTTLQATVSDLASYDDFGSPLRYAYSAALAAQGDVDANAGGTAEEHFLHMAFPDELDPFWSRVISWSAPVSEEGKEGEDSD